MPNHLVTVSVPPMHLAHLGIDANDAKPPLIAQPTPTALGLGFAPGDVLVTVVADGMQHDATTYTAGELLQRTAGASGRSRSPYCRRRASGRSPTRTRGRTRTGVCSNWPASRGGLSLEAEGW